MSKLSKEWQRFMSKSAFAASRRVWFCICSKDGRARTNLICADK